MGSSFLFHILCPISRVNKIKDRGRRKKKLSNCLIRTRQVIRSDPFVSHRETPCFYLVRKKCFLWLCCRLVDRFILALGCFSDYIEQNTYDHCDKWARLADGKGTASADQYFALIFIYPFFYIRPNAFFYGMWLGGTDSRIVGRTLSVIVYTNHESNFNQELVMIQHDLGRQQPKKRRGAGLPGWLVSTNTPFTVFFFPLFLLASICPVVRNKPVQLDWNSTESKKGGRINKFAASIIRRLTDGKEEKRSRSVSF